MRKIGILATALLLAQGCATSNLNQVANDAVNGAIGAVLGTSTSESDNSKSYSIEKENISAVNASKTKKDYGSISVVKTEKNPKGQTKLILDSCKHPLIGELRCGGYIFEVTKEGWLIDSPITFDDLNHPELTIPAGTYYIKAYNWETGMDRFVTGEFTIKPFVTNFVALELE